MGLGFLGFLVDPTDQFKSGAHRQFSRALVWVITLIVGNVTPLAFIILPILALGCAYSVFEVQGLSTGSRISLGALGIWCALEILFYAYCLSLKGKFMTPTNFIGGITSTEKKYLSRRYLEQCPDPWAALVRWFPGHSPEDIGLECMEEWVCWAYFSKSCSELTPPESEELSEFIAEIVKRCPRVGRPSAKVPLNFMQLHFDKLVVQHKPLIAMLVISIMQYAGSMLISMLGFYHHSLPGTLSYWSYEPEVFQSHSQTRSSKQPIFIVHGIGIGIAMYYSVVKAIVTRDPTRPVYILDLPHISLKIVHHVPNMEETLEAIDEIFNRHQLKECSWLAHSYGTIVTAWVIKERPKYVNRLTFVDPVCFALWDPDLIYNFLYRVPPGPIHRLCQFFVAQDLLVSYTLFRNFWWSQNILFPQDITCPAKMYLSSHDFIIDERRTRAYLHNNNHVEGDGGFNEPYDVVTMEGLSHGSFLSSKKYMEQIVNHL